MAARARHRDLHAEITSQIVTAIEQGASAFQMPWHQAGSDLSLPVNARTGRHYSGINILSLWAAAITRSFFTGYWATYRQWQELGAQVCKGERATSVVFYKEVTRQVENQETGEPEEKRHLFARASRVFNADQVEGWTPPVDERLTDLTEPLERAEAFVAATGASIRHGGARAYYDPAGDFIAMPERRRFTGTKTCSATEAYYATLLHELVHWTGHELRLKRDLSPRFKAEAYAMEELVAELGAAFLCAELTIANTPRPDHAAYIDGWLKVLRSDTRAIFTAARKASQAAHYLHRLADSGGSPAEMLVAPTETALAPPPPSIRDDGGPEQVL